MFKTCEVCGVETPKGKNVAGKCLNCYTYFKNGGTINPIPPLGVVKQDNRGYIVCHICGRAFKKLGNHVKRAHDMSVLQYKEYAELSNRTRLTERGYHKKMHDSAKERGAGNILILAGASTRFTYGTENSKRLGKPVRLQELYAKRSAKTQH